LRAYKSGNEQGGLFDYQERKEALSRMATPLDRLNERVDWELSQASALSGQPWL
jgi:hypothetical protein